MVWKTFLSYLGKWFIDRAQEKTTWAGLVLLASDLGVVLTPELAHGILMTASTLVGGLLVAMTEKTTTQVGAGSSTN